MTDTTITALFDNRDDAQAAVDRLVALGLPVQDMHMTGSGVEEEDADPRPLFDRLAEYLFPDVDRDLLERSVEEGAVMLTVIGVPEEMEAMAMAALDDAGAVEIDEDDAGLPEPLVEEEPDPADMERAGDDPVTDDVGDVLARIEQAGTLDEMGAGTSGMRGMGVPHAGAAAARRARLVRRYARRSGEGVAPERGNLPS